MRELPNSLIVLTPTPAMLDWINSVGEEQLTLEEVTRDPAAIVIPSVEGDDELESLLEENWRPFFEMMLAGWSTPELWPDAISYEMFRKFVQVKLSSMLYEMDGTVISEPEFGQN